MKTHLGQFFGASPSHSSRSQKFWCENWCQFWNLEWNEVFLSLIVDTKLPLKDRAYTKLMTIMINSSFPIKTYSYLFLRKMVIFDQKWLFFTENGHFWFKNDPFFAGEMWKTWIGFNALVITVNFYLEQSSIRFQVKNGLFFQKWFRPKLVIFNQKLVIQGHEWTI